MFSWCFKRQNNDDDEYRQRPKTRNTAVSVPTTGTAHTSKSNESVKSLEQLQNECLEAHNEFRARHGVGPLTLNKQLCLYATEWAKHLAKSNMLQHRTNNKYGENLYVGTGMGPQTHVLAVQAWYEEIKNYNFNKPGFSPNNGHFTQLIWKTSTQLGIGIETRNKKTWIVCNYDPPGNVMGNYGQCVPPLIEETVTKIIDKMKPKKSFLKTSSKTGSELSNDVVPTHSRAELKQWSQFELECLYSHNKYRAIHNSPNMKLNRKLCNLALNWSKQLAKKGSLSHRPKNEYGENIYYAMNFDPTAEHCVKSWYNEITHYNFSKPGFSSQTGHFTQVVWRDSIELGVGITKLNNMTFVVCNYSPAGNVMNEYKSQVLRPGENPSTSNNMKEIKNTNNQQQSFEEVCLDSHNNFRALHGSPAMTLNKNLSFFANDWAQHLATNNKFETRKNNRFGENIFCSTNKTINGQDPVEYWYNGIQEYNFNRPDYNAAASSFTQVIWKSSKQLGVGVAKVGRSTYVVCNYDPKGNIMNSFAENVSQVVERAADSLMSRHQEPLKVDQFTSEILKIHNTYRIKHGCPPLKLSQELMDYCQNYANHFTANKPFNDSPKYVLNSIVLEGITPSADLIVSNWYNEIENYDFEKPQYTDNTKHFTQIVWKNSRFLGVGISQRGKETMIVLSYEPPGNIENQYGENVPPNI